MKRGSSQGKWGNVSSTHIYIHSFCTRACTRAKQSLVRKQLAPEGSLPHFRPFIPLTVFPSAPLFLSHGESPCRSCPRIRSDLKRLRCRKTTCMRPSRGVNWTLSRQTIRLGEITSQLFSFESRGWTVESIECGLLSIALYSSAVNAGFLLFYCATGESFFKDRKKNSALSNIGSIKAEKNTAMVFYYFVVCNCCTDTLIKFKLWEYWIIIISISKIKIPNVHICL